MYGLHKLIDCPTTVTCNTSTLTDHILTNTQNNVSRFRVIDALRSLYDILYHKSSKSKIQKRKGINFLVTAKITQLIPINRTWKEFSFQIIGTLMTLTQHIMILLSSSIQLCGKFHSSFYDSQGNN